MRELFVLCAWATLLVLLPLLEADVSAGYLPTGLLLSFAVSGITLACPRIPKLKEILAVALLSSFLTACSYLTWKSGIVSADAGAQMVKISGTLGFLSWGLLFRPALEAASRANPASKVLACLLSLYPAILFFIFTFIELRMLFYDFKHVLLFSFFITVISFVLFKFDHYRNEKLTGMQEAASPIEGPSFLGAEKLTNREREVVVLLLEGLTQKEAATELGISPSTVGTYRSRAFAKLAVSNTSEIKVVLREHSAGRSSEQPMKPRVAHGATKVFSFLLIGALPFILACLPVGPTRPLAIMLISLPSAYGVVASRGLAPDLPPKNRDATEILTSGAFGLTLAATLRGAAYGYVAPHVASTLILLAGFVRLLHDSSGAEGGVASQMGVSSPEGNAMFVLGCCLGLSPESPRRVLIASSVSVDVQTAYAAAATVLFLLLIMECRQGAQLRKQPLEVDIPGNERCILYLRGRGLGELEARAALLLAKGLPGKEICRRLSISPGTLNSYRFRTYSKLGLHSRRELRELLIRDVAPHLR